METVYLYALMLIVLRDIHVGKVYVILLIHPALPGVIVMLMKYVSLENVDHILDQAVLMLFVLLPIIACLENVNQKLLVQLFSVLKDLNVLMESVTKLILV